MFELLAGVYLVAIVCCFVGAAIQPNYRGPLIALGVVLTIPVILFAAGIVFLIIAMSNGAHLG